MRRALLLPLVLTVLLAFAPLPLTRKHEGNNEKRFTLAVKGKTWPAVFKWLSKATGKPVISIYRPIGTCNVTTPPGKRYTVNEVIDLLNEELLRHDQPVRLFLLPRERLIALVSPDALDGSSWRVAIEDLPRWPRSVPVVVSIVLPLKSLDARDLEPQVKKMMGPFGDVGAVEDGNALVLVGQVTNIKRIVEFIRNLDSPRKPSRLER